MAEIKLFVCCHQQSPVPSHPLLVPIQVGAALAETRFPGFLQDDTGDNISGKNTCRKRGSSPQGERRLYDG